jgi:hypothetical protein
MEEQKPNISALDADKISFFIKSLGGVKAIYSYLKSKNVNINIESIYKWKNNGIPYRYLLYIKELSNKKNINIPENIFPANIGSLNNKAEKISSMESNRKNIKGYRIPILIILLFLIIIILQFLYHHNNKKAINEKIIKLENLTLSFKTHDYDKKLDLINDFIIDQTILKKQHSSDIKSIYSLITTNKNKLKDLEKNIGLSLNNSNKAQNFKLNNFNTTLINLLVLKENIKFSIPNLNNIDLINNYFSHVKTPDDVSLSLLNLNNLSKINLKSHKQLIDEILHLLVNINNENNKKKNINRVNILIYLKNLIKISKINNNDLINKKIIGSNIINNINNHNYDYILNDFKSINSNIELNEWLENINNLNILIISLDNIINWLVYKG